jgi:PST family polysaccharide transporter
MGRPQRMTDQDHPLSIEHLTGDLGGILARGNAVMFGAQGVRALLQFGSVIILARLLPPGAFGLIAMVVALGSLLDLAKELGLSTATIQRRDVTQAQVSALFWINGAAGCVVAVALALAAPLAARFYGQPDLVAPTRWLALGFVMSGFTIQHWALLRRRMQFGVIAVIDLLSDTGGLIVAVVMAAAGAGFWALLAQRLVPTAINLAGSWIACRWRPDRPRRTNVRELLSFGLAITGSNVATVLARSVDQILVGWMWGPTVLGLYERAAKLLMVPLNTINTPLYAVALPALSRLADETNRYRSTVCGLIEKLAMATMPTAAAAAVAGDWLTRLLFGPSWSAAIPLVICFCAAGVTQPVIIAMGMLYLPLNRGRDFLRSTIVDSLICIVLFCIGLPFGGTGVAAALAAGSLVARLPVAVWLATRRGPVSFRDLSSSLCPSLIAALAAGGAAAIVHGFLIPKTSFDIVGDGMAVVIFAGVASCSVFLALPRSRAVLMTVAQIAQFVVHRVSFGKLD